MEVDWEPDNTWRRTAQEIHLTGTVCPGLDITFDCVKWLGLGATCYGSYPALTNLGTQVFRCIPLQGPCPIPFRLKNVLTLQEGTRFPCSFRPGLLPAQALSISYQNHNFLHMLKLLRVQKGGELLPGGCLVTVEVCSLEPSLITWQHFFKGVMI